MKLKSIKTKLSIFFELKKKKQISLVKLLSDGKRINATNKDDQFQELKANDFRLNGFNFIEKIKKKHFTQ